jgi:F-type H+-transporting ATPase subunit epsilon
MPGDADQLFFYVTGGILEVQPHLVTVLADTALHAEQLDENAAMEARKEAEEAMKGATGKEDIEKAQEQLVEAAARYRAAQKLRGKR